MMASAPFADSAVIFWSSAVIGSQSSKARNGLAAAITSKRAQKPRVKRKHRIENTHFRSDLVVRSCRNLISQSRGGGNGVFTTSGESCVIKNFLTRKIWPALKAPAGLE